MRERSLDKAAEITAAGITAVASGANLVGVGAAVLPPLVGWAAGVLGGARQYVVQRRLELWLFELAQRLHHGSVSEAQRQIEANIGEPWLRDGLLESFRHTLDALDEELVVPAIARLTAQYFSQQKAPDVAFRSRGRLLVELDRDGYETLQESVSLVRRGLPKPFEWAEVLRARNKDGSVLELSATRPGEKEREKRTLQFQRHELLPRLFGLLKKNDLGTDNPGGFYDTQSGPHVVVLNLTVVDNLLAIL